MNIPRFFKILCAGLLFVNCSNNDVEEEEVSIIGEWELTEWRIGIPADINKDGTASLNLLDEIDCDNSEVLTFGEEGFISVLEAYAPKLYLTENASKEAYTFNLNCEEGVISAASSDSYTVNGNIVKTFGVIEYLKDGAQLTNEIENHVEIYNEDLTEILGTLTSTKVYTKR